MQRIEVWRTYRVHELLAALDCIAARWSPGTAAGPNPAAPGRGEQSRPETGQAGTACDRRPALVIVDAVSAVITPVLGRTAQGSEGGLCFHIPAVTVRYRCS